MSDFVNTPLDKKMNPENILARLEEVEARVNAMPSMILARLDEVTKYASELHVAGGAVRLDEDGVSLARPGDAASVVLNADGILYQEFGINSFFDSGNVMVGTEMVDEQGVINFGFNYIACVVPNYSFNTTLDGWDTISGTPTISQNYAHLGVHSALLNSNGESIQSTYFIDVTQTSGFVKFWVYPTLDDLLATVEIKCYDSSSVLTGTISFPYNAGNADRWQSYLYGGKYPANTTKIKIYFSLDSSPGGLYLDEVRFLDGNGYLLGVDGGVGASFINSDANVDEDLTVLGVIDGNSVTEQGYNLKIGTQYTTGNIADDGVYSISVPKASGIVIAMRVRSAAVDNSAEYIIAYYNTGTPALGYTNIGSITSGTTGALTGTTGTDGRFTVSAHTDGKLYFENRTGGARSYEIVLLGSE